MSGPFGSSQWMYSSGAASFYDTEIDGSLRFNDNDSAYLSWTPPATHAAGRATYTFSCWFKISGGFGTNTRPLFGAGSTTWDMLYISSGDVIAFSQATETISNFRSNAVLRDPSAWYHIVLTVDTTEATDTNRVKCWLNGEQVTWSTSTYPSPQNETSKIADNVAHYIGKHPNASAYWDGYFGDMHFVSGQALDPTSFGETKSGVWIPKAYSGSYGTNGFHLEFAGNANDSSGNGNNFTANNISSYDYVPDSPTNNFATLNPLGTNDISTFSQGNLQITTGSGASTSGATMGMSSGKWYAEFVCTAKSSVNFGFGLIKANTFDGDNQLDEGNNVGYFWVNNATVYHGFASDSYGATVSIGDVVGIAFDADTLALQWYKNGVGQGNYTRVASENTAGDHWIFGCGEGQGGATATFVANFGQDSSFVGNKTAQGNSDENGYGDFYYTPPTGYLALCTANLTVAEAVDPAEDNSPQDYFNTVLYNGTGSTQTISGVGFQPDFIWTKSRNNAGHHILLDAVRGNSLQVKSNTADAEVAYFNQEITSDGFSTTASDTSINGSGYTYVSWNWKANGSGVSNTDGSITSTVSANTTSGFSVVSYTGDSGTGSTVGHGLSSAPEFYMIKNRDSGFSWTGYHEALGSGYYIQLDSSGAQTATSDWNNTAPTSSVFTVSGAEGRINFSGTDYIAYCFHSVEGFSKFGSYTGNGSTDGPFVYTGFRPAFVMVKSYTAGEHWNIPVFTSDTNGTMNTLSPNLSNAERTMDQNPAVDFVSNGFKIRTSDANYNSNGGSYIYMAFAENPFKYANAR